MKTLLDISRDNLRRERSRGWSRTAGAAVLFLVSGLVIWYVSITVTEQRDGTIFLKETVDGINYLYVREEGHLLKLKCGSGVDSSGVTADEQIYRLDCRWNRRTYRGTVTACRPKETASLGGLMDVTFEAECVQLFGQDAVYYVDENTAEQYRYQ